MRGSIDFDYGWMVETDLVWCRSIVTDLALECCTWLSHEVCISEINPRQNPLKSQSPSQPYLIKNIHGVVDDSSVLGSC